MKKSEIEKVKSLILSYASGDFSKRAKISNEKGDTDALLMGINMLGEELQSRTISRDYFSSIYDSVSEMIFVIDKKGLIHDSNKSAQRLLHRKKTSLLGKSIMQFNIGDQDILQSNLSKVTAKQKKSALFEQVFKPRKGNSFPVQCQISQIEGTKKSKNTYLLIAADISEQRNMQQLILRTTVETQDAERQRLAHDLHDSLGQELVAAKMFIDSISISPSFEESIKTKLLTAKNILNQSVVTVRKIVYDLMPSTLEEGNLLQAIDGLVTPLRGLADIDFSFSYPSEKDFVVKPKLATACYRIIQEFITNSLKHSKAPTIKVFVSLKDDILYIRLSDNGEGFNMSKVKRGYGLSSIKTRVMAYNGKYSFVSRLGVGTSLKIEFSGACPL